MYEMIWNKINAYMDKGHAVAVFLPVLIAGWTAVFVSAGICYCILNGMNVTAVLADIVCTADYAGLIFGLLGGCLFLYRKGRGNKDQCN